MSKSKKYKLESDLWKELDIFNGDVFKLGIEGVLEEVKDIVKETYMLELAGLEDFSEDKS